MGFFDFFKKKKKVTLLDKLNELQEKSDKISNSALQFYKLTCVTLPKKLFHDPENFIQDLYKRGKHAIIVVFSESCLEMGQLPKKDDVNLISFDMINLRSYEFFVINFPHLTKNENNGLPVPTPISIAILKDKNTLRYFVLGLSAMPSVECSIREVTKELNQMNLGFVPKLNSKQFIEEIVLKLENF